MPGSPQELQDFSAILKNVYLPVRVKAFPLMTPLLSMARKGNPKTFKYGGNDIFFDVKLGRRAGFVASASGFFPDSKTALEKQGRLSIARTYATVMVDGLAIKAGPGNRETFIPIVKKVIEDVTEQWQLEQNRILHGDSLAIRATISVVTSTTVVTAINPYGITGAGPGNLLLETTEDISVLSSDGVTQRGKTQVLSIVLTGDNAVITYNAAVAGQQVGDLIVSAVTTAVNATDTSFGAEPHGLKSIMDVEAAFATFEGINDARWVAQKLTSTTLDETIVMRLLNTIRARAGVDWRSNPSAMMLLTTTGIWQKYGDSLLGLRRFDAPIMKLNGGFTGVAVAGAALVDDPWCPRGRLYAVHTPDTVFIDLMDFKELQFQDSPRWRLAQNQDAFEAIFASYWNYGVLKRSSQGVISGITDTINFSPVF